MRVRQHWQNQGTGRQGEGPRPRKTDKRRLVGWTKRGQKKENTYVAVLKREGPIAPTLRHVSIMDKRHEFLHRATNTKREGGFLASVLDSSHMLVLSKEDPSVGATKTRKFRGILPWQEPYDEGDLRVRGGEVLPGLPREERVEGVGRQILDGNWDQA